MILAGLEDERVDDIITGVEKLLEGEDDIGDEAKTARLCVYLQEVSETYNYKSVENWEDEYSKNDIAAYYTAHMGENQIVGLFKERNLLA